MNYPAFVGPSNASQSALADCERTVNLYVEPNDQGSGRPALYPTPGAAAFVSAADVGTRALFTMNARTLAVIGPGVSEIFGTKTITRYGDVAQDGNPAQITMNGITGNQALIASGGNAYVLNLSTNVLSGAVLAGEAQHVGMLDGFGIAFHPTLGKLRISALNDFTTWDSTQYALRSSAPDKWKAMIVNAPDIVLIGEQSGDFWYDAGTSPFPYAPRPGATFKYGIAAPFSLAVAGDSVLWLSQNAEGAGLVVRARGYVPLPIGSYALDTAIARYQRDATIADAEALVYQRAGHTFYVLKFPAAGATWVYDLRTGLWHERGQWNSAANRFDAWHPRAITYAFGQHLIGEGATAAISVLDDTVGVEADGSAMRRVRIPPALQAKDGGRLYVDRFEVGIEPGVGTATGQGANPVAALRISRDNAKTWGNERTRPIGRLGETKKRVFWTRNGSSDTSWVPEIVITDPVPTRIVSASIVGRGLQSPQQPAA